MDKTKFVYIAVVLFLSQPLFASYEGPAPSALCKALLVSFVEKSEAEALELLNDEELRELVSAVDMEISRWQSRAQYSRVEMDRSQFVNQSNSVEASSIGAALERIRRLESLKATATALLQQR